MNGPIIFFTLLLIVVCTVSIPIYLKQRKNMQKYWLRYCTGVEWKRQFPDAPSDEIRRFLTLFINAFLFKSKQRLKFSPSDRIMDIYHAVYFDTFMADALELETFVRSIEKEYRIDLLSKWREDFTMGDIFTMTRKGNAQPGGAYVSPVTWRCPSVSCVASRPLPRPRLTTQSTGVASHFAIAHGTLLAATVIATLGE